MSFFYKKIVYLSCVEYGVKVKKAGFMKMEIRNELCTLDMHVSGMEEAVEGKYDIYVMSVKGREASIGSILLHRGKGDYQVSYRDGNIGSTGITCREIDLIYFTLSQGRRIEGRTGLGLPEEQRENGKDKTEEIKAEEDIKGKKNEAAVAAKAAELPIKRTPVEQFPMNLWHREKKKEADKEEGLFSAKDHEEDCHELCGSQKEMTDASFSAGRASREAAEQPGNEIKMDEVILNDKWDQLCHTFPVVHPYEDERQYISIQPKDFVVMTGDYQHLANNSFLLHGFYNYRHLILGQEWQEEEASDQGEMKKRSVCCFYLGVPGVYYEREKMVARMFGFEAFECSGGRAETGKFGYYLKRVRI